LRNSQKNRVQNNAYSLHAHAKQGKMKRPMEVPWALLLIPG
jgi:hypothetical protein